MRRIALDASNWKAVLDFYDALLPAVGAPDWHGRNINAVVNSMVFGGINAVEPPFAVTIVNTAKLPEPIRAEVTRIADAIQEARKARLTQTGKDVPVSLEFA